MDTNAPPAEKRSPPARRARTRLGLAIAGLALATVLTGLALAGRSDGTPAGAAAQPQALTAIAWTPPPGVVQISPCVPFMGEHWANPANLPLGPIYTVHDGRLISIEYMIAQAEFQAGMDWLDLTFGYLGEPLPIEHANIEFLPRGHEGFEVPHYDLHFYLVTHAEERAITCQ